MRFCSHFPVRLVVALIGLTSVGTILPAHADLINAVRIADTTQFASFGAMAINNSGVVAFSNGGASGGIYRGNGGALTSIANSSSTDSSGYTLNSFGDPTINDAGEVAFTANFAIDQNTGFGVYHGNGAGLTTVENSLGAFSSFRGADINNSGTVAFTGSRDAGGGGIYVNGGSGSTLLLDTNNPVYRTFGATDINNSGQIAFQATRDRLANNAVGGSGIYRLESSSSSASQTLVANSADYSSLQSDVTMNDSGQIIYRTNQNSVTSLYLGNGTSSSLIADTAGPFQSLPFGASINSSGQIAFMGYLDNGSAGIFSGSDPLTNRIIGVGDAFDGSTVTQLIFYDHGLNDLNQIAFAANLADGRQGIYRASIMATPEPATWAMMVVGLGSLMLFTRRKRKVEAAV